MRRHPILEWLDEITDGQVLGILKAISAGALVLSIVALGYRALREYQAETDARNAQAEQANKEFLQRARKSPDR